ncbi:hypothetical protein B5F04_00605 [Limosilactobacillus reuteri]|nr:hypothetical protein B5F04_00605 [Limosilactobacillus reuteri]
MPFVKYRGANGEWIKLGGGNVRVSNGHTWIPPRARIWNGHEWLNLLEERHVDVFNAVNSGGYWGSDHGNVSHNHFNSLWAPNHPLQGNYRPYHDSFNNNGQHGMIYFNDQDIRNRLAGAKIEKTELFLYAVHSAYYSGGECVVGTHNFRGGWSDVFQEVNHSIARTRFYGRNQGQWITLPNWVGDNLRDNLITGITTNGENASLWQYIVYAGTNDGWKAPKLRITYWK